MKSLETAARWELMVLIGSFGVVCLWQIFRSVTFAGLLRSADGSISPGRIQLLVLTVMTAMQYLLTTIHDPSHLPTLPSNLVTALGGSHLVYLGAKAWSTFQTRRNN